MRLENKKAIVTGGAGGIGRATSLAFAAEGASVAVVDLNAEAAEAVAEEIRAAGGNAIAIGADVSSEDDIIRVVATANEAFGGIDVVFNNAGIIRRTTAVVTTVEEWDRVFGVNVRAIFLMCKHVVPVMKANGGGSIVNTGSGWGLKGGGQAISYCASKGAVVNMTRALAIDHGPDGIRVNSVNPGDVDTGMLRDEAKQLGQDQAGFLAEAAERPLNRMGQPSEIAAAVVRQRAGDNRVKQTLPSRHPQAAVVEEGALAALRRKQLVRHRVVDHAGNHGVPALQPDRKAELRDAMQEIGGAIERVDNPCVRFVSALVASGLFAQKAVARPRFAQLRA